jgi:hypothetical protein
LQIGDRWQYKETPPPVEPYVYEDRVVSDTLMPNWQTYAKINIAGGDQYYFYRQDGPRIYEYIIYADSAHRNQEIVRFDWSKNGNLNLGIHDTVSIFQITDQDTVVITVLDTGHISIFGTLRPFKTYYWNQRGGALYRVNRIIDSIGTSVYQIEPGYQIYLTGAVLEGVEYGNVVSVGDYKNNLASGYFLLQNFPNPFNPTTTITFHCGRRDHGRLVVYDINGRLVKTLFSGEFDVGYRSVVWDGTTDKAAAAATGVYIYRLEVGTSTRLSRIMMLLH